MKCKISVVIVNWNTRELLARCINNFKTSVPDIALEFIVVDNGSADGSREMVKQEFPHVKLIESDENLGFAKGNNVGVEKSSAEFVLLINTDAFGKSNFLSQMLSVMEQNPTCALVGAQLRNADGTFQASHTPFPNLGQEFLGISGLGTRLLPGNYPSRPPQEDRGPQRIDWLEGACMLIRKTAFEQINGFDEGYWMYSEDTDLCYRLHAAGWECWYQPAAIVTHISAGSSRSDLTKQVAQMYQSRVRFYRKFYGRIPALALKLMIITIIAIKRLIQSVVRTLTRKTIGREQVSLRFLNEKLSQVV